MERRKSEMTELEEFREQKDVFLATDRHSPLTRGRERTLRAWNISRRTLT
jgi:hypothetical protein